MSALVERLIGSRDDVAQILQYATEDRATLKSARDVMADAANFHTEAERRIKDLESWWYAVPEEQRFGIMSDAAWERHQAAGPL